MENFVRFFCFLFFCTISKAGVISRLNPGDAAPGFGLQTNSNLLSYPKDIQGPLIVVAFTNDSAFLENMLSNPEQLVFDLIEYSPDNAHYVFVFHDTSALGGLGHCKTLEKKLHYDGLIKFHSQKWLKYSQVQLRTFPWNKNYTRKNLFPQYYYPRVKHRLHCASFPIHMLGNWIPRVLAKWSCENSLCGLYQIAFENAKGHVLSVSPRLDARHTWLPPFETLVSQSRYMAVDVKSPCALQFNVDVSGKLAVVYAGNTNCSAFAKVRNAERNGAIGVVFYDKHIPKELNCHGKECETLLSIPACIVHNQPGFFMDKHKHGDTYIRFQTTPAETFTFGVDSQGRLQKTDWYLYPSMRFAAYHAQWFNYVDNFISNTTGEAKVIKVFDDRLMSIDGLSSVDITVPSYDELILYQNVEVEMSLRCPLTGSGSCTHWDHVVRLFVSCGSSKKPVDELARWIVAYNRRSSSWITPIRSLLPLLKTRPITSSVCSFHMRTQQSVKPWQVTLKLRLSDKTKSLSFTTWKEIERELVPVHITRLFTGCFFDENCNKKYSPISFTVAQSTAQVKLVASITGHGHDDNNCAGKCITAHRFNINHRANATYTKIYKNSESSLGCQVNVEADDTKRRWLRSREPWCDGQEVIPWEVDITDYVMFGSKSNTINYRALFNGTESKPTRNPGTILMSSYIVYYEYKNLV